MGADFIFWWLSLPKGQKPNWKAGEKLIESLDLDDPALEFGTTDISLDILLAKLKTVRQAWEGKDREGGFMNVAHLQILITGGVSGGDSPTDLGNDINDLEQGGILDVCGFNLDEVDYKAIILKILKTKEIAPLLMGVDEVLDKMIEKSLRK